MEFKIEFKNRLKVINLILAFVWPVLGALRIIIDDNFDWVSYTYMVMGVMYLGVFYLQSKRNYILIKDGILTKCFELRTKKIPLSEIKSIRKFAGDYKLRSESDELIINTQMLEDESLSKLNMILEELDIVWE